VNIHCVDYELYGTTIYVFSDDGHKLYKNKAPAIIALGTPLLAFDTYERSRAEFSPSVSPFHVRARLEAVT